MTRGDSETTHATIKGARSPGWKRLAPEKGFRLHTALLASMLVCVGAIIALIAAALVPVMSRLLESNAIERTRETVRQGVNSVEIYVDTLLSTAHFAGSLLPNDSAPGDDWRDELLLLKRANSDISAIAFFDADGTCLYSTAGELREGAEATVRQREWFKKALAWDGSITFFSAPYVQSLFRDRHSYVITLSRAVGYREGGEQRTGVLMLDVEYSGFAALADRLRLGSTGYVYIIDENGRMIAHPRLQLIYAGLTSEDTVAVDKCVVGSTHDTFEGRERVLLVNSLAKTRWRMVGVAYADETLHIQYAFMRIFTTALLCAGLLALAVATVMAYAVTRPITHLEHKMRLVEAGDQSSTPDLNVTISVKGFREIRAVSATFNHMLERIRELMARVVREEEAKRLYELNALQSQINPHFLYNTLDSIIWMEERGRGREAIIMVSALAKLFRISISKGRSMITVREELEHVRNYVIIQKMRFKDKFDCEITVGDDAVLEERTVKLILQPLVENSINHAIDEILGTTLHIRVDARADGDELVFTVSDDGVGIPEEQLGTLLTSPAGSGASGGGIGVKNVHERVRLTYGEPYGLTIESEVDEGTRVTILIPRAGKGAGT